MALEIFAKRVVGRTMHELTRDMGKTWRYMVSDSQYRWIGPEKSVTHLAVAGVLNAVWDLWGKILSKPVWQIVCDMSAEEIVRCIDFRYITDVITPEESLSMLKKNKWERRVGCGRRWRIGPSQRTRPAQDGWPSQAIG
jgi:L-galactonate dehydratase